MIIAFVPIRWEKYNEMLPICMHISLFQPSLYGGEITVFQLGFEKYRVQLADGGHIIWNQFF